MPGFVSRNLEVRIEAIEPGSPEDLFNRADAHCELCEGIGMLAGGACPCTTEVTR